MSKAAELAKWGEVSTNGQVSGRRNIIINGAMNVAQRSASETALGATAGYYTLDRFKMGLVGTAGRFTMTQTADGPSGFANCLKLDCTTADTSIGATEQCKIEYRMEGQDVQQIKKGTSDAEKVTVSFYVKGNAAATYTCELQDTDNTRYNGQEFSVTTDWTRIVLTFAADTTGALNDDNALSFLLDIWLHAGSNFTGGSHTDNVWHTTANQRVGDNQTSFFDSTDRTFFITGLQMEVGSVATPFEHRSYGEELALCQRYYQKWLADTANDSMFTGAMISDTAFIGDYFLKTSMRAVPSIASTGTFAVRLKTSDRALATGPTLNRATPDTVQIAVTIADNNESGFAGFFKCATSDDDAFIEFIGEL